MVVFSLRMETISMPENDTAQWTRGLKLAAVAGPIALGVFGAAFLVHGSLQLFGWGFAAGSIFLAAVIAVDAYVRRGRPDTSRATVDERRRKMRALTAVGTAIGGIGATLISVFDLSLAPVLGFVAGAFAFMALFLSPLFDPNVPSRPPLSPASPLSRMTSMERLQRRNYE